MSIWTDSITARCSEVSIIGLRFVVRPSSSTWLRLFWLVLISIGIALCTYQISDRVSYFLSLPTSTGIRVERSGSIRFPAVTLCNENRMQKTAADRYNLTAKLRALMLSQWDNARLETGLETNDRPDWSVVYQNTYQNKSQAFPWFYFNNVPVPPESIVLSATELGYCFTFNSGESNYYKSTKTGPAMGMNVLINAQQNEYSFLDYVTAGYRVMIRNNKDLSYQIANHGFLVAPGFLHKIVLGAQYTVDLPSPYSDCNDSPDYRRSYCTTDCLSQQIIQQCGCKDINVQDRPEIPVCGPYQLYRCRRGFVKVNTSCKTCPQQCTKLSYNYFITQAPLADVLPKSLNASDTIMLQIYFTDFIYTYVEKLPSYSSLALWCDIGGALSLVLGCTLLTFVELMDAAAVLILRCLNMYRFRKRSHRSSETCSTTR